MSKKGMRSLVALLLAFALTLSMVPVYAEYNAYVRDGSGKINLRSGPATQYRVLAAISPYTPLEVIDVIGKWAHVYVADPNGNGRLEGYMYIDYIEYYDSVQYDPTVTEVVPTYDDSSYYDSLGSRIVTEYTTMYVYTGNSGKLHLRAGASQYARSLGLYPNGTKVTVLNRDSIWAYVEVNGVRGFMMLKYLSTSQHYYPVTPIYGTVTKYINTGNSGRLHLREYPSQNSRSLGLFPNGTRVSATDLGNGWSYVTFDGHCGYMMTQFLSLTPPYVSPTPYNPSHYKIKYVCLAHGHVSLRSEMSDSSSALGNYGNGTVVYVIYDYGIWSYVFVNGQYGYMKNSWLADSPYVDPQPVTPIGTAVVRHPNGSFVYLRSSRSTADLSNVLAKVPSGSVVKVYQKDEWYSLIEYNGIKGYMVSSYLYYGGGGGSYTKAKANSDVWMYSIMQEIASYVVAVVPKGAIVDVYNEYNGWLEIKYGEIKGYAKKSYFTSVSTSVTPVPPQNQAPIGGTVTMMIVGGTPLRSSRDDSGSGNIIAQLPHSAIIEILFTYPDNWRYVSYNGIMGYIHGQVVASIPTSIDAPISVIPTVPESPVIGTALVQNPNSSFVYLRSSRSTIDNSNVLAQVPTGAVVELMERSSNWSKVRYNGIVGYMVSSYLVPLNQTEDPETPPETIPSFPIMPAVPTETQAPPSTIPSIPITPAQPTDTGTTTGTVSSGTTMYINNPNSTFVYLRSSKNSDTKDNIITKLFNNRKVIVLEYGELWSRVRVGNQEGYVVSRYLSYNKN